jgi:cytochrome c oxidase subunit II
VRTKHPLRLALVLAFVACIVIVAIGLTIPWFPAKASAQAGRIQIFYKVLIVVTTPIFVGVTTVILFCVWQFRMKPGQEDMDGPPIHGNTRLEVVWTAAPAVLIVSLCVYAFAVLHINEESHKGETVVNVTERQFAFEFSYRNDKGQVVVSPDLYMADNQPYVFHIRSMDVIHSFFVPNFSEKIDAVPGIVTTLRVTPTREGAYPAECTELCGAGHSLMRAPVFVVSKSKFQTWLNTQKPGAAAPPVGVPEGPAPASSCEQGEPGAAAACPPSSSGDD